MFSVLIPIYINDQPRHVEECINSVINQTLLPDEIVIVLDGPIDNKVRKLLYNYYDDKFSMLKIVDYKNNRGLGHVLRDGIVECSNEIIARMDADDVARFDRFELQFNYLRDNPEICMVGSFVKEFNNEIQDAEYTRVVPTENLEINSQLFKRNPFNHMTVMFRKEKVLEAGNYKPFQGFEDYNLWVRMYNINCKFANIPEVLVFARIGNGMYTRRGGLSYLKQEFRFQGYLLSENYIGCFTFFINSLVRGCMRLIPSNFRKILYNKFLRK